MDSSSLEEPASADEIPVDVDEVVDVDWGEPAVRDVTVNGEE